MPSTLGLESACIEWEATCCRGSKFCGSFLVCQYMGFENERFAACRQLPEFSVR